jgi:ABC-type sugar transport system substrate-binding protein
VAAVLVIGALVTGCTSTTAGRVHRGSVEGVSAAVADPSALRATIGKAFLHDVPAETLDPVIRNALAVASVPFSDGQRATYERCLSSNVCETGRGSLTIAFPNDNVNPYRSIFRGEFTAQAIASPQVKKIIYSSSNDIAGFLANFRSLIVQQVDIIVLDSIYAGAIGPAIKQAKDAGVVVIEAETPLPPDTSSLVDSQIATDFCQMYNEAGQKIAAAANSNRTYALYTGIPGNSSAATWQPCLERTLQDAHWTRAVEGFTQWTPQGTSQAANALLASGKRPGALVYDYTPEDFVKPYVDRRETPPLVMTDVVNQSWFTTFQDAQAAQLKPFSLIAHSRVWLGRTGVTAGIMIRAGQPVAQKITAPAPIVSMADVLQYADPSIPANTPVPSLLTTEQIKLALSAS